MMDWDWFQNPEQAGQYVAFFEYGIARIIPCLGLRKVVLMRSIPLPGDDVCGVSEQTKAQPRIAKASRL